MSGIDLKLWCLMFLFIIIICVCIYTTMEKAHVSSAPSSSLSRALQNKKNTGDPKKSSGRKKKLCSLKSVLSLSKVEWRRQRHGKRWQKGKAKVFLSILVDDSVECYSLFYFIKINLVVRSTFLQKKKKGTQKSPCLDDLYKK